MIELFLFYAILEWISNVDFATTVNLCLTVLSFVLAVMSMVFVIITLRQNNKMLEAESRPYVVAYLSYQENREHVYLCIKNFGKTSATVTKLNIMPAFSVYTKTCNEIVNNTLLVPGQQIHFLVEHADIEKMRKMEIYDFKFCIEYTDCCTQKHYKENYSTIFDLFRTVAHAGQTQNSANQPWEDYLYGIERSIDQIKNMQM